MLALLQVPEAHGFGELWVVDGVAALGIAALEEVIAGLNDQPCLVAAPGAVIAAGRDTLVRGVSDHAGPFRCLAVRAIQRPQACQMRRWRRGSG